MVHVTSAPERMETFLRAVQSDLRARDPLGEIRHKERCPKCERPLAVRLRYLATKETVRVCDDHGVWFDPGVLASVLSQRRHRIDAIAYAAKHADGAIPSRWPLRATLGVVFSVIVWLFMHAHRC